MLWVVSIPPVSTAPVRIQPWHEAFLGVSALLGEALDDAVLALHAGGAAGSPVGHDRHDRPDLGGGLMSPSRRVRAEAIARAVMGVVVGLEQMRLQ